MKKFASILSFVTVLGFSILSSASPIAYYPFSGNANDASGNGYNGTVYGASLATDRFGNTNGAYGFNGINNYIDIPEFLSPDIPAVTISAWVKPNSIHDGAIVYKGLQSGEMILRSNSAGTYDIGVKLSDGNWFFTGGGAMDTGNWQHIAGTYSKGNKIEMWVDGVLENSTNIGNLNLFSGFGAPALSSIGSYQKSTAGFFNGIIDDVAVYNYALSGTDIQTLAKDGPPPPVSTPEPAAILLLGIGLIGLAGVRRKFTEVTC